jgi:hypothetical protein
MTMTPIDPSRLPSPEIRRALFAGMKVMPQACDVWLYVLRQRTGPLAEYPLTLGQMSADCERQGHLLRVCGATGDTLILDHGDLVDIVDGHFSLSSPTLLADIDAWRQHVHGEPD